MYAEPHQESWISLTIYIYAIICNHECGIAIQIVQMLNRFIRVLLKCYLSYLCLQSQYFAMCTHRIDMFHFQIENTESLTSATGYTNSI